MLTAGISENLARQRLEEEGANELKVAGARRWTGMIKEVLLEPMVLLLVACGLIDAALGDVQEALILLGFLAVIIAITLYQERRSDSALQALRRLSSPRALVVRDGASRRIAGREVVRGDLMLLEEGTSVAADAQLLSVSQLLADESMLTGESAPVAKAVGDKVFAGTTIVRGGASSEVVATGARTALGQIGHAITQAQPEMTRLQQETRRLVSVVAWSAAGLCGLLVVVYGLTRHDWLGGFLSGLTLAMAILPNELPAVLMIFLSLGALRLSRRHVLTRKMAAVEDLGAASVLCVDKTGTLTMNQMAVRMLVAYGAPCAELDLAAAQDQPLAEIFHPLVEFGILASNPAPFDPMEQAVHRVGGEYLAQTEHLHPDWQLAREYPLTPQMLAMSQVWQGAHSGYVVGTKGAPEAIMDLCHLAPPQIAEISAQVARLAEAGLRVLGVAKATFSRGALPGLQHDYDFEFLGLLGLSDPLRPGAAQATQACHQAGVRVMMMTGDHAKTASHIAREVGLENPEDVVTGPELAAMDDETLRQRLKTTRCFARMVPEQKLRLVELLKREGEVVAMTGDGVNDAPALKSAHIGIAMGKRGTDVAREASALVLLDDDFSSIVEAIRTGRRIFDNLRAAMAYLLAVHLPIAALSIAPVLLKLPLLLLPVHIAFLHLIIEPACSVVFEAEAAADNVMRRPPRGRDSALFSRNLILPSLLQGLVVSLAVLAVFWIAHRRGQSEGEVRAVTFTTLMIANVGLIWVNRAWSRSVLKGLSNRTLWWVSLAAVSALAVALYLPWARTLFRFAPLHPLDLALCLVAGVLSTFWFEIYKYVVFPRHSTLSTQ